MIIVLCFIALLAIAVLFFGILNPGKGTLTQEAAKNNACQLMIAAKCNVPPENINVQDFDADKDGRINNFGLGTTGGCDGTTSPGDNLYMLCKCWYSLDEIKCKNNLCGCISGGGVGGEGGPTGPYISSAQVNPLSGPPGTIFTITASVTGATSVSAHIQKPDETDIAAINLYDDGIHSDGAANDGTYGNTWDSTGFPSGPYFIDIIARDNGNVKEAENI